MPMKGLKIFRWWYGIENEGCPLSNVWQYDLGKSIIPIIFKDVDLLLELVERYDHIIHEIIDIDGNVFLKIHAKSIR